MVPKGTDINHGDKGRPFLEQFPHEGPVSPAEYEHSLVSVRVDAFVHQPVGVREIALRQIYGIRYSIQFNGNQLVELDSLTKSG